MYYYEKTTLDIYEILFKQDEHSSSEFIATAPDIEKADFLVKAANFFNLEAYEEKVSHNNNPDPNY